VFKFANSASFLILAQALLQSCFESRFATIFSIFLGLFLGHFRGVALLQLVAVLGQALAVGRLGLLPGLHALAHHGLSDQNDQIFETYNQI